MLDNIGEHAINLQHLLRLARDKTHEAELFRIRGNLEHINHALYEAMHALTLAKIEVFHLQRKKAD